MGNKRHFIRFGGCLCVFLLIITPVIASAASQKSGTKPPIKVGIITGMTGYWAYESATMVEAIKLGIKQFNESGGILGGRQIEYTVFDDRYSPDQGVSGVRMLASEGYKLLIGGISSDIALAENEVVKEKKLVMIHPMCMHPDVSKNSVAFSLQGDFIKQLNVGAREAIEQHKPKTVAALIESGIMGRAAVGVNKKVWGELGVKIVADELYEMGTTEFKPVLTSINAKNPDLLYVIAGGAPTQAQIVRQAKLVGVTAPINFGWTICSQDFPELAGQAAEGIIGETMWVPTIKTPENIRFVEAFKKEYGRIPYLFPAAVGYEAVNFLLRGVEIAGTDTDSEKIKDGILSVDWVGPTGRKGGLDRQTGRPKEFIYVKVIVKNGTWVPLK